MKKRVIVAFISIVLVVFALYKVFGMFFADVPPALAFVVGCVVGFFLAAGFLRVMLFWRDEELGREDGRFTHEFMSDMGYTLLKFRTEMNSKIDMLQLTMDRISGNGPGEGRKSGDDR